MVGTLRTVLGAWGGMAPTVAVCAGADLLTAVGIIPPSGAIEVLVVAVTLQLVRWRDASDRRGRGR
ncbi:MAG: hypothetical protein WCQ64_11965 [Acidobacteriota bacterium]